MGDSTKTSIETRVEVWTDVGIKDDKAAMFWFVKIGPGEAGHVNGCGDTLAKALRNAADNLTSDADSRASRGIMVQERSTRRTK